MTRRLSRDDRGLSTVEFALTAPALLLFIIGIIQLGILFSAYAGMTHAVNEGARYATIFPTPTNQQIAERMTQKRFMVQQARMQVPDPTRGTVNGVSYIDLSMTYSVPLNFVFFSTEPVQLRQTRRAWLN